MSFMIPHSLKAEHDALHAELIKATQEGGKVGEAAREVARVLHAHFVKEEEYALPPLGLLPQLAQGQVTPEMAAVIAMADRLKEELPTMLAEHQDIVAALNQLADAARSGNKPQYAEFAEKLRLHAQAEEEVAYPTTLLIGEYVKLKLSR
jgi:hemerythrin superfamily protein